jgi:hypothetical protein
VIWSKRKVGRKEGDIENRSTTYTLWKTSIPGSRVCFPGHFTGSDTPPFDRNFQIGGSVKIGETCLESEMALQGHCEGWIQKHNLILHVKAIDRVTS